MNIKNTWTYADTIFHYFSHTIELDTLVYKFEYYNCINGYCGYSNYPIDINYPVSFANSDTQGNLVEIGMSPDTLLYKSVYIKKNAIKGEKWTFKSAVYTNSDYTHFIIRELEMTCTNTDTLVHTPKGSFNCKAYSYSPASGHTFIQYLSENVGVVMLKHYEGENLFRKRVLIDFYVKL
jgi:hypothetical protein